MHQEYVYQGHVETTLMQTEGLFSDKDSATRFWCRLNRILVNDDWIHKHTASQAEYLMPLCSDHSPGLITIDDDNFEGKKPFKFFNMWAKHPDFLEMVKTVWSKEIRGYTMYRFYTKLRNLKPVLKDLNKKHFMDISQQVLREKSELCDVQKKLNFDLFNSELIVKEKDCIKKYTNLMDCKSFFYRQKANIKWALHADKGSQLFHSVMKSKRHQKRVLSIYTKNGSRIADMDGITSELDEYYKKLFGNEKATSAPDPRVISNGPILSSTHCAELSSPISRD
ncbi:uncharacterized protein LOC109821458 [Asparagus officinalis]|uniref:uncharacterized protein LOC109821458 n=1 Tax=Asparagus officinalis TaxID=4686 RepID=UPI00098E45A2|nr:uncharacterized protein LOC109821458 [Asparagus officinalis]